MEGTTETEIMRKQSETTNASIGSQIQEMEDRISSTEDTTEEIDLSVKENIKSNKNLKQNIQKIWYIMKRQNPRIIKIEVQLKSTENIFNKNHRSKLSQPKERYEYEDTRSLQNIK